METNVPHKSNPVLLDIPIQELQNKIKERLPWVDVAYGRAYKRNAKGKGPVSIEPVAYIGRGEYTSLFPNDRLRAFSFFDISDPQTIKCNTPSMPEIECKGAVIFWYDLSKIFSDNSALYSEELKNDILKLLTSPSLFKSKSRLVVESISERLENIYKGYNLNNIDYMRYLAYPYGGLRVEFKLKTENICM